MRALCWAPTIVRASFRCRQSLLAIPRPERSTQSLAFSSYSGDVELDAGSNGQRTYAGYKVYRGQACMSCTVIPPKFVSEQGSQGYYTRVSKPGVLLLEFAMRNKDGPESNDVRSYDWENKEMFALSVSELGMISEVAYGEQIELKHFPDKDGMRTAKTLYLRPLTNPGQKGFLFQLSVQPLSDMAKGPAKSISVPVDAGDFGVIRQLARYLIPHLLGLEDAMPSEPIVGYDTRTRPMGFSGGSSYPSAQASQRPPQPLPSHNRDTSPMD